MESLEPKKLALIRILQILYKYSDETHPLTQDKILRLLYDDYGLKIERKAVGRNISLLKEAGVDIINGKSGAYLAERQIEDSELKLLIDGVLSSRYINVTQSRQLIKKLCNLSNVYFNNHVKNIYSVSEWNKTDNPSLFYNIEIIDEAIEKEKQVTFDYNKFDYDKKLHYSSSHKASPYQLILKNQRYYLMALNEKWDNIGYYRLERITNIKITDDSITPIRKVKGYENGINYRDISSALPYMFTDKLEKIVFKVEKWAVDQVADWFGNNCKILPEGDNYIVNINASPNAMEYWAMQYLNCVEIISPLSLRERIINNIKQASLKYSGKRNDKN